MNTVNDIIDDAANMDTSVLIYIGLLVVGLLILVAVTKRQTAAALDAPYVDFVPKLDDGGNPVTKTMPDGSEKPVLVEQAIPKSVIDPRSPDASEKYRDYFAQKAEIEASEEDIAEGRVSDAEDVFERIEGDTPVSQ